MKSTSFYYGDGSLNVIRHIVSFDGSFFDPQQMVLQHVFERYFE